MNEDSSHLRRFNAPLSPDPASAPTTRVCPYPADLVPLPSPNRPHCPARDRLRLWIPHATQARQPNCNPASTPIPESALNHILETVWYRPLIFHVYCDLNCLPESERCPISQTRLIAFLASLAGAYSGAAISNYASAICAWHLLHGFTWDIKADELKLILEGASKLAPRSSKLPKCPPLTSTDLKILCKNLNPNDPCDTVILACITMVFYCVAKLGEFTVPAITKFTPGKHIARHDLLFMQDLEGRPEEGENVQCAPHPDCITDPEVALKNHLRVNPAPLHHPKNGLRPLSKNQYGLANIKGHSLCIGGTLHYLLKGIPFEVVKVIGCWAGAAFTGYLREHTLILAPFLQLEPEIFEAFKRIAMPPWVRFQM
ncbi:hypothetical protein V8E55_010447 [Tylopilus felleus]